MGKQRHREVKELGQAHAASECWRQAGSESTCATTVPCGLAVCLPHTHFFTRGMLVTSCVLDAHVSEAHSRVLFYSGLCVPPQPRSEVSLISTRFISIT